MWKKTQNLSMIVRGNDSQFDVYKLPIFFNLCITSTGLKTPDRNEIKAIVEDNGGRYNLSFTSAVDILIMEKESIGCQKFNAAVKLKKLCLSTAWIFDSLNNGYAMPVESYTLGKTRAAAASTPTKVSDVNLTITKFNPDNTQLSDISRATIYKKDISLNETGTTSASSSRLSTVPSIVQGFKQTLIDAKNVGSVLDGYNILLSGFSAIDLPIISKIVSVLGATKMDSISEQVTHVIIGTLDPQLFADLNEHKVEAAILKVDWLKSVVEKKMLVEEAEFEIPLTVSSKKHSVTEKPSPASKKAMKSLSGVFKKPDVPKLRFDDEDNDKNKIQDDEELDLVNQYLGPSTSQAFEIPENNESNDYVKFLTGKYIFIYGYSDPQAGAIIINECEKFGATLVDASFRNEVDYFVTPPGVIDQAKPEVKYKHIVSDIWIEESAEAGCCIDPVYYHKPIAKLKPNEKPLKDEVFVVSNYKGSGRTYINMLVENLGGKYKEIMKRTDNGILLSPNDVGKKFESAQLWNWAVLSVDWLLACLDQKQRVDESPFLIGCTNPSKRNLKFSSPTSTRRSIVFSSQDIADFDPLIENTPTRRRLLHCSDGSTPTTPSTPILSPSRLVQGMPTPQRQDTLAVLLENQKNQVPISPRKKRLEEIINTPSTRKRMVAAEDSVDSLRPETPECMKPQKKDYGIRPKSTPNSQAFHKRKLEGLDLNYIQPAEKKRSLEKELPTVSNVINSFTNKNLNFPFIKLFQPPYAHRRYDFYKQRIADFNSPDPRENISIITAVVTTTAKPETQCLFNGKPTSSKSLDFNNDDYKEKRAAGDKKMSTEETFRDLQNLEEKQKTLEEKRPSQLQKQCFVEESGVERDAAAQLPLDSEHLVEWEEVSKNNNQEQQLVFAITGIQEQNKSEVIKKIIELGGTYLDECSSSNIFTHLICPKPNRGEKYMMAIACGKFVMHADFIHECHLKGRFIDEAEFEFGNPNFRISLAGEFEVDEKFFKAPYMWRKRIAIDQAKRFKDGAFTGKSFIIASQTRNGAFLSIIKAGGGKHVEVNFKETLKSSCIKGIDFCLHESGALSKENLNILKQCKVTINRLSFISDFLMHETIPD